METLPVHTAINTARLLELRRRTPIVSGTPQLPIGTPTGKTSALLQATLIRLGILLRSSVAMMRIPQSGHGNL